MIDHHRNMLQQCLEQFESYATQHRMKAARYHKAILGCSDEVEIQRLKGLIRDTEQKAIRNEEMVREIKASLDRPSINVLADTARFANIVHPDGPSEKDRQTQIGVHFEEVVEMLEEIQIPDAAHVGIDIDRKVAITSLKKFADSLKGSDPFISIPNRVAFIDSIADQLVTATVSAQMLGMRPVAALLEVNRSNYSKLTDGVMKKDPTTNKWIKGPNYTPPQLLRYA